MSWKSIARFSINVANRRVFCPPEYIKTPVFRWWPPNHFQLFFVLCPISADNFMKVHSFLAVILLADTKPQPHTRAQKVLYPDGNPEHVPIFSIVPSIRFNPSWNYPTNDPIVHLQTILKNWLKNRSYVFRNVAKWHFRHSGSNPVFSRGRQLAPHPHPPTPWRHDSHLTSPWCHQRKTTCLL